MVNSAKKRIVFKMKKIKNTIALQIVDEFKKYESQYRSSKRLVCNIFNISPLTKLRFLKIAKETKNEKTTLLSRDEQRKFLPLNFGFAEIFILFIIIYLIRSLKIHFLIFFLKINQNISQKVISILIK
jgi:hypothetical protein